MEKKFSIISDSSYLENLGVYIPLPRTLNGFRLVPVVFQFHVENELYGIIWRITPQQSIHDFYFRDISQAMSFAKKFSNNHRQSFWNERYMPLYSFECVASCVQCQFCFNV